MTLAEILTYFTIGTISIVSMIGFIGKSVFNNFLDRKIESYKNDLARENDLFKSQLQKDAYEHQVKFTRLHTERAEVIKILYQHLTELRKLFDVALSKEQFDIEDTKRILEVALEAHTLFNQNKLYFTEKLCDKVKDFFIATYATNFLFEFHEKKSNEYKICHKSDGSYTELDKTAFLEDLDKTGALKELEAEFRKLLGVS